MNWWNKLLLRWRSLFHHDAVDRELDSELRFHLEEQIAENIAAGMDPQEAKRAALVRMGGMTQIAEACRDARNVGLAETTWQDLRFGARMLAKSPAFAAVAILTLAIGIGFNTMSFSAVRALLFGGLSVTDPDRLVLGEALREGFDPAGTSLLEYSALRNEQKAFSSTALSLDRSFLLRGNTEGEEIHAAAVSPGFFETLGVSPHAGRLFSRAESQPGGAPAVILAYDLWQRHFGGDPAVLGRSLDLDDRNYTIVGVMPRGFDYPTRTQAWVALDVDPETAPMPQRIVHGNIFVGRLRNGVSFAQATAAVKEVARQVAQQFPQTERGWSYGLLTMRQWSIGDDDGHMTTALVVLVIAIGLLLLICCVNVANLLLVRGVVREGELVIRVALGASRGRVARQLLTEGVLLALLGGGAGLVLAFFMRVIFRALSPIQPHSFVEFVTDFRMDTRALLFCLAISLLSGLLFSLLPAMKLAGLQNPIAVLRQREHRVSGAAGRQWLRALVVAEIATAVSLSFGGALLTRSFYRLGQLDLGFRPEHLLTVQLPLSPILHPQHMDKVAFSDRVLERVRALPGVESAGVTTALPMQDFSPDTIFTVEGHPPRNPSDVPIAAMRHVSPGYAETLGLTLLQGRMITAQDRVDTLPVAVITEELARQAFGHEDPLGKRLRRGRLQDTQFPWLVVIGVVRDSKEDRLNFRIVRPVLYIPLAQRTNPPASTLLGLVVRTAANPSTMAAEVRSAVREVNPYQPVLELSSMEAMLSSVLSADRFSARLMAMLACVGLFLATLGLYSVIAYSVTQRTGEIGLRMALGAQRSSVAALIAREAGVLVGLGLALSVPAMFGIGRLLSGMLFGVSAADPAILLAIAVLLTVVAFIACFVPTRRALQLDPLTALRYE